MMVGLKMASAYLTLSYPITSCGYAEVSKYQKNSRFYSGAWSFVIACDPLLTFGAELYYERASAIRYPPSWAASAI